MGQGLLEPAALYYYYYDTLIVCFFLSANKSPPLRQLLLSVLQLDGLQNLGNVKHGTQSDCAAHFEYIQLHDGERYCQVLKNLQIVTRATPIGISFSIAFDQNIRPRAKSV